MCPCTVRMWPPVTSVSAALEGVVAIHQEVSGEFETPHLRLLETVNFPSSLKSLTFGDMFNQSLGGGFRSMFIYYPESLPVMY